MIPLRVSGKNYGPYASVSWEIAAGLTAVVARNESGNGADSNGSGKTKLLELIPICLFGPPRPWSEYLTLGSDDPVCTVELEFSHGGERYRVRRTYDARGRGKTLLDFARAGVDAQVEVNGQPFGTTNLWHPLTRDSQTATQNLIEQTIGISQPVFEHSVFASQGARHFADPSLPPRERKAILVEALGLDLWDNLKKLVDADISDVKTELAGIEQRLAAFAADLDSKPQVEAEVDEMRAQVAGSDAAVARFEQAETEARAQHERFERAASERETLEARLGAALQRLASFTQAEQEAEAAKATLATLAAARSDLEPLAARADELVAQVTAITVADSTREQAERERRNLLGSARAEEARADEAVATAVAHEQRAKALQQQVEAKLNGNPGVCDHCGQPLAGEALKQAVASITADRDTLRSESVRYAGIATGLREQAAAFQAQADVIVVPAPPLGVSRDELNRETVRAQEAQRDLAVIDSREESLRALVAKTADAEWIQANADAGIAVRAAQQAAAAVPPPDTEALAAASRELERAHTDLSVARAASRTLAAQLATSEERLRNLVSLAERAQEALLARAGLQGRLDVLAALARSYGRDGIPALLLEALAIPHLETAANRILDQLDARMRFELVTQRENKGGGLKDTLDVLVHGERGSLRYESYSGGEQTRLAFALRVALARLVVQNGAEPGILCLDEMVFLDATGIAKICEVLRGLSEFRSIVVVSHDERFVEAFDQVVTVVRDDTGSRIEEAA